MLQFMELLQAEDQVLQLTVAEFKLLKVVKSKRFEIRAKHLDHVIKLLVFLKIKA